LDKNLDSNKNAMLKSIHLKKKRKEGAKMSNTIFNILIVRIRTASFAGVGSVLCRNAPVRR
jgi:heme/copper-type cytochrome/quinol oxidase subunit 4